MVGKLIFLTHTRPDIAFAVSLVAQYMQNPHQMHLHAVKTIIRYLKGTISLGLHYKRGANLEITRYSDADWRGDPNERKSTGAFIMHTGPTPITWYSKKQTCIALSSTE